MQNYSRRNILKMAGGIALSLPFLESMAEAPKANKQLNLVAMQMPFGFLHEYLYPKEGQSVFSSDYMAKLKELEGHVTLFNGFHNPGINGEHTANYYFLTCGSDDQKVNNISIDQEIADLRYKGETRFKSLVAGCGLRAGASYTRSGIKIPVESNPADVFAKMFLGGKPQQIAARRRELAEGKSILDAYSYYSTKLKGKFSKADNHKLDQYFTAVREVERSLEVHEMWLDKPMPKVERMVFPKNTKDEMTNFRAFIGVFKLALENNSTSLITYDFGQSRRTQALEGVEAGYHDLSHHRKQEDKLKQLHIIESEMFKIFADFLKGLKESNFLDSTICLFGSGLENPNNHSAARPPVIVAGGGLEHKGYVNFGEKREALGNLYVNFMHKMGVDKDSFGSSTGKYEI